MTYTSSFLTDSILGRTQSKGSMDTSYTPALTVSTDTSFSVTGGTPR